MIKYFWAILFAIAIVGLSFGISYAKYRVCRDNGLSVSFCIWHA